MLDYEGIITSNTNVDIFDIFIAFEVVIAKSIDFFINRYHTFIEIINDFKFHYYCLSYTFIIVISTFINYSIA